MHLIDLKKDPQPIDSEEMYDEPMYSYGLCISLGREELEKLGIEKLPEAGSEMMIKGLAYVKTVRESKEKEKKKNKTKQEEFANKLYGATNK